MKTKWLNRKQYKQCVLFFNGWGMDEMAVSHIDMSGLDICMCYDYTTLDSLEEDFSAYQKVIVVAWSLGVWAAGEVLSKTTINIEKAIALNGTLQPVDVRFGIAPSIFKNTQLNWNISNRMRFNRRVLGGKTGQELSLRRLADQQLELKSILREVSRRKQSNFYFDSVLIGQSDLIFIPSNQWLFWKGKTKIIDVSVPHYPFSYFKNWKQIIRL